MKKYGMTAFSEAKAQLLYGGSSLPYLYDNSYFPVS